MENDTAVDDLAAWLTHIWVGEEAAARAALAYEDSDHDGPQLWHAVDYLGEELADHIAAHDPTVVLARIAADRQILELHVGAHDCVEIRTGTYPADWPEVASWGKPGGEWRHAASEHFEEDELCPTVRLLASAYADRPGYREDWTL